MLRAPLALALLLSARAVEDPTAELWAKRLSGEERAAARAELLALGKRAGRTLGEVIAVGDDEAAWQAVTLLAVLGGGGADARERLEGVLGDEARPAERRAVAALGLGAGGYGSKAAADVLADLLRQRPAPALSVAARVACANLAKGAAGPAAKLVQEDDALIRQYGAQVLCALGPEAAVEKKALLAVIEADGGYLLYGIAKTALERIGKPAARELEQAWLRRLPALAGQMGGGLLPPALVETNAVALDSLRRKRAFGMENEDLPTERIPLEQEMSLPERFRDFNEDGSHSVGEIIIVWGEHLALEVTRLRDDLYGTAAPATFADWRARSLPVERSTEGLETLFPEVGSKEKQPGKKKG